MRAGYNHCGEFIIDRLTGDKIMANYRNNNTVLADKLRKIIKREMDKMGILVPELAKMANLNYCSLRNYINGRNDLSAGNVFALIRALGIRIKFYREKKC